jgi:hypothetical protein
MNTVMGDGSHRWMPKGASLDLVYRLGAVDDGLLIPEE